MSRHRGSLLGLAAASGLLLFVADFPLHLWPLQAVALVPLLVGLMRRADSMRDAALAGVCTGLVSLVPLAVVLKFPALMAVPLCAYLTLVWVLICVGAFFALKAPAPWGALGAGAVAVLAEWVDFNLVPVWGTAQCFARVWSAAPWAIQLVELVGMCGLVFVLVASQALLAGLVVGPRAVRVRSAVALVLILGAAALYNGLAWPRPTATVRVAAMGWTREDVPPSAGLARFERTWRPMAREAVRRGARLVVSPEVGLRPSPAERARLFDELSRFARAHRVWLAVGHFDQARDDNRIAFFDDQGRLAGEYIKTHLIIGIERYRAGQGELVLLPGPGGARLGGMICQDDNFTDLARAYGRRSAQLLAVPTNDWKQVKDYHLENALFRGVENRYGVVRAATNGISAIVSPTGEVLARADHFAEGAKLIVADLPLVQGGAPYSRLDLLPLLCLVALVGGAGAAVVRRRQRGRA